MKYCCQMLRNLVPGVEDKTDKATVLEHTVHYLLHLNGCQSVTCDCYVPQIPPPMIINVQYIQNAQAGNVVSYAINQEGPSEADDGDEDDEEEIVKIKVEKIDEPVQAVVAEKLNDVGHDGIMDGLQLANASEILAASSVLESLMGNSNEEPSHENIQVKQEPFDYVHFTV
ncbi:hypothetical protein HDE_00101 [Halotydeus destructor]|nr:hypothetical protein HDE_00101 [Halotydeus destructor]